MAYVIAEPCMDNSDQSCVAVCPVDCITADPNVDRKFYIDPEGCIECGPCESACPNQAIFRRSSSRRLGGLRLGRPGLVLGPGGCPPGGG